MAKQESTSADVQPAVHLVLQGKGGVGKSFVAAILAQYFKTKTAQVHCLDTDPVNGVLSASVHD
jgi:CO dehydrogenase nickel-insertion accessory protein CooC1